MPTGNIAVESDRSAAILQLAGAANVVAAMLLTPALFEPAPQEAPAPARLIRKLRQFAPLSPNDTNALERLLRAKVQTVEAGVPLIEMREAPSEMHIVLSGWAARHRGAGKRPRQILAFHLPGDVCDFDVFLMRQMDSTITALSTMRVATISRAAFRDFIQRQGRLAQALWWESLSSNAIQREWLVRNTCHGARERVASLVCELAARLYVVGLGSDDGFDLPLTQQDLADACGMTSEHTNRTLRELREQGLMTFERGHIRFDDWEGLSALAQFDPAYLHFRQTYAEQVPSVASVTGALTETA